MKQIFKLFLVVMIIAASAGTIADAKTRRRASGSSGNNGIPTINEIFKGNQSKYGVKTLYEEPYGEYDGGWVIQGKNCKVVVNAKGGDFDIVATGPHAFYIYDFCNESCEHYYGFSDKADRDRFYNQMLRNGFDADNLYKSYDKGWYYIEIE